MIMTNAWNLTYAAVFNGEDVMQLVLELKAIAAFIIKFKFHKNVGHI